MQPLPEQVSGKCLENIAIFAIICHMNPEERHLLERSLKLSEENNQILRRIDARAKRAAIYGFIKLALILAPFVIGYFLLEPYLGQATDTYDQLRGLLVQ
jgi:hypothetical protein